MNAALLATRLEQLGVRLFAEADELVVDAPTGVLTDEVKAELRASKAELLQVVRTRSSLIEYAADRAPAIRLTVRETGDAAHDFELVARLRRVIAEFQPGGNHICLKIVTLDGRRVVVEWRALADRQLRLALAQILAQASRSRRGNDRTL